MHFSSVIPTAVEFVALSPRQVGGYVLQLMNEAGDLRGHPKTLRNDLERDYPGGPPTLVEGLTVALAILTDECYIVRDYGDVVDHEWFRLTEKGRAVRDYHALDLRESPSPLRQVDDLIAAFGALHLNDVALANELKERALVIIRYLSDGNTRLYMSVANTNFIPARKTEPWRGEDAATGWQRSTRIVLNALNALREGLLIKRFEAVPVHLVPENGRIGIEFLLQPSIIEHAMKHYYDGDYRNAVSDAMLVLTELIRQRTGLTGDGDRLAIDAFKLNNPLLEFTPRSNQSEKDEHEGFFLIIQGAFKGVRNPKIHQLLHDLDAVKAAQYLVFISLLVRRVEEATRVTITP